MQKHIHNKFIYSSTISLSCLTLLSTLILSIPKASAESSSSDTIRVSVPVSCYLESNITSAHDATLRIGTYTENIGSTTLTAFCNDANGFALYAVGYTDEEYGKTVLAAQDGLTSASDIATGTATSGATSAWSMKLASISGDSVDNGFTNYSNIPSAYTKVASKPAATSMTTGSSYTTTYAAYISESQLAGTYEGKVKYTLVHPNVNGNETNLTTTIIYDPNADNVSGSMTPQIASGDAMLTAPNYGKTGYGFAAWNTKADGTGINLGPNQTINLSDYEELIDNDNESLTLYAKWVPAEIGVTMQTFNASASPYSTMQNGSVIALKDERDNDVYAVAKLADGNWWMIENLRLDYDANITTSNTQSNNGEWGGVFAGLPVPETANFSNSTAPNSLYTTDTSSTDLRIITDSNQGYRFPRYNNNNTTYYTSSDNIYSYGNYYTWAAAVADTAQYTTDNQSSTSTSLCPKGWHLPKGGNKSGEANNEWWNLIVNGVMNGTAPANYNSEARPYYTDSSEDPNVSEIIRAYPNNIVLSGRYQDDSTNDRGLLGTYWSSTSRGNNSAYRLALSDSVTHPGDNFHSKFRAMTIRCLADN